MSERNSYVVAGEIVEEQLELTLSDLCRACDIHAEWITRLVEEGVLDPIGGEVRDVRQWRFRGGSLRRARTVVRLQRDLGINLAGAALALELMDEIETLRARLRALQREE